MRGLQTGHVSTQPVGAHYADLIKLTCRRQLLSNDIKLVCSHAPGIDRLEHTCMPSCHVLLTSLQLKPLVLSPTQAPASMLLRQTAMWPHVSIVVRLHMHDLLIPIVVTILCIFMPLPFYYCIETACSVTGRLIHKAFPTCSEVGSCGETCCLASRSLPHASTWCAELL